MKKNYFSVPYFSTMKEALTQLFSPSTTIASKQVLSGGDIATTQILLLKDSTQKFSYNQFSKKIVSKEYHGNQAMNVCQAETTGLISIASTQSIATAKVYGIVNNTSKSCTLLLDYWEQETKTIHFWENFAHQLAKMHTYPQALHTKADTITQYFGFDTNNYIGKNVQKNTYHHSWVSFFTNERILYQLHLAIKNKYISPHDAKQIETLCNKLPSLIPEASFPSLLHGDLWSGNYLCIKKEQALLIDPAVYYGHYEADIAMTELFGSCNTTFYKAYNEILPLDTTYQERKHIYNIYHLLNHLNLFGTSYLHSVMNTVQHFL